jgi:hypothetical protein
MAGLIHIPETLPRRLDAQASLRMAWLQEDENSLKGKRIDRSYAKTACGTVARSRWRNRALLTLADRLAGGRAGVEPVKE